MPEPTTQEAASAERVDALEKRVETLEAKLADLEKALEKKAFVTVR